MDIEWVVPHLDHPNLTDKNHSVTSDATLNYNCIAWALGVSDQWWEPDFNYLYHWPNWLPRDAQGSNVMEIFASYGYRECDDEDLEAGYEKVSLFIVRGSVVHAARQLPTGRWTSKMGLNRDIEHDFDAVVGGRYGSHIIFLRRPSDGFGDRPGKAQPGPCQP